jgi:syntaxin 18
MCLTSRFSSNLIAQLNHIGTLTRMLSSIRKPYLSVDAHAVSLSRHGSHTIDLSDSTKSWSGIRYLTDEERDQVDLQARVVLTRCADRVKEMEKLEKRAVCFSPLFLK